MVQREENRSARTTLKQRREQVLECFASAGLKRGPHRIVRSRRTWDSDDCLGAKLRVALGDLGPIFSSFGRYLGTRVDLLPAVDCVELEAIPDVAAPMSYASVRQLIGNQIGCLPEEVFLSFEREPFESRLLHQLHRARLLQNSMPVVVKLVRNDAASLLLCDVELLDLIDTTIERPARTAVYKSAIADFAAVVRQQLDLTHEARSLETLRRDAENFDALRVPAVISGLSSSSMLTVEQLPGTRVDSPNSPDGQTVARLLCSVWLRQALMGHVFAVEPGPANMVVVADNQIGFTGGVFANLPGEAQANLGNYLIAAAGENPDQACSCLLRELKCDGAPGAAEDLRHRFRQVVPFRDSGWYSDDNSNRLIEHLVVHWQGATDCGYLPRAHAPAFFRGLFAIARLAQRISPETDALLEGLQEARLLESVARAREMLSLQRLGDQADRYAALMMAMPQRLDQMLNHAFEGNTRVKLHVPESASHRRQKNSAALTTAMLLLLAAIAFALPRVTSSLVGNNWSERINAVAFVACGALLLWMAGRTR